MVFSSNIFLFAFLPICLALYFAYSGKVYRNAILLCASLIFYAWGELQYLWLLLLSILGNYLFGLAIGKFTSREVVEVDPATSAGRQIQKDCHPALVAGSTCGMLRKSLAIFIAISFNLALLCYFKYANFLLENLNEIFGLKISNEKIRLPIGISFFTFHAISYLVDIYRRKCAPQKNLFSLALYIAFFPQLIAGPIVRYNFIEKYLSKRGHSWNFTAHGIRRFIIGLGKKIIIANPLGQVADAIFASPLSEINQGLAWVGIVCYTLQIYFDFSGYCDMAIGLARICGFRFPENFNYPYISRSIKEFWRRWHMSLSAWFRDYVYIPLGGNRVSITRQYFNLVLVFFLCGLWHGASWNFVVWGLFHGMFLVFERIVKIEEILPKILQHFYAILVVIIGWVFFRSSDLSYALGFIKIMFFGAQTAISTSSEISRLLNSHFLWMSFVLALLGFSPLFKNFSRHLIRKNKNFSTLIDVVLTAILLLSVIRISASTHNPFIYFQF